MLTDSELQLKQWVRKVAVAINEIKIDIDNNEINTNVKLDAMLDRINKQYEALTLVEKVKSGQVVLHGISTKLNIEQKRK